MEMEMWSSGSAFLFLTSCGARAVPGVAEGGDVRVFKPLPLSDISPLLRLSPFLSEWAR